MSLDLLKEYIDNKNKTKKDCLDLLATISLDDDERKLYEKKIKKKPDEEIRLSLEEQKTIILNKYGWWDERCVYSIKIPPPESKKKFDGSLMNLGCNVRVAVERVASGICKSVIHQCAFLGDHKTRIDPPIELRIKDEAERLCLFKITPKEIREAIKAIASQNEFNPIAEYINAIKNNPDYEGVLYHWLPMVCGCEDIDVVNKIGLRWAVQLVARALQPGRYNESVLGLCAEGGGEGKSKFVRNIVYDKSLAYEGAPNLDNTQSAAQTLIGSWVVDFSEGEAVDRHSQETNKRFITQDFDKYVEKFENTNVSVKRPYAFVMTTNNETPLLELSIASVRRFQFVKVKKFDAKMMLKIRDQLYYEANQFLQLCDALRESGDNEPYILTDSDKEELVEYSKQFVKANTLTFQLREFFKDTVEPYYRVDEMLATARAYEPKCSPQILWNILRDELGFTKEKKKVSYQFNGEPTSQRTWVYVPPKSNATKIRVDDLNADQAAVINILEPNSKDVKSNLETQWLEQLHYMSKAKDL